MASSNNRRTRSPPSRQTQVSKKLSWLLRHGATTENLPLLPGGYALLSDVLSNRKIRSLKISLDEIKALVQENDKQRFSLIPNPDAPNDGHDSPSNWLIRANQGHSVKLEGGADALLTEITMENRPAVAVHGTTHRAWTMIVASGGLKPMGRNHVHLAQGLPAGFAALQQGGAEAEAPVVISGMRSSSTILVFVDLEKALKEGLKFGLSENGVILTEGNAGGIVPLRLFSRVEDRTGQGVLVQDGEIAKEAPSSWSPK